MDKNIHSEDEYFKKAYQHLEDEPSPDVWSKLDANLTKQDAARYRKKFLTWRSVACLLFFILGSLFLYNLVKTTRNTNISNRDSSAVFNNKHQATAQSPLASKKTKPEIEKPGITKPDVAEKIKTDSINYTLLYDNQNHAQRSNPKVDFEDEKPDLQRVLHSPAKTYFSKNQYQSFPVHKVDKDAETGLPAFAAGINPETSRQFANRVGKDSNNNVYAEQMPVKEIAEEKGMPADTFSGNADKEKTIAANHTKAKKTKSSFKPFLTLTPYFSTDFTFYKLDDDDLEENNTEPEEKEDIEERERHEFSYSAGILAKLQYTKKLGIKTGLQYSNISIGIQPQTLYAANNGDQGISYKYITSSGYAYVNPNFSRTPVTGDSIGSALAQHHLQYLTVPASFSYTIVNRKKFWIEAAAGASANFLLSTTVKTEVEDATGKEWISIHKLQGLRRIHFSFVTDANLQFYISKRFNFSVIPSFKYAITPITKNNIVKTFPYSFGIGTGFTYKL